MPRLRNIEDLTLAMADDEFVSFRTARPVLGTYLERNVTFEELTSVVGRLSNLGLLRWRVRRGKRTYLRRRVTVADQRVAYLAKPRDVT